eukprot:TRINITY_DN8838_c0_g1_i1.p1 TRINITY_DN8838_c0_g1~~TRINITY_DN8838_c0_g1_i1.p1  ORF type:complete len:625 (+),score=109.56 TRINITY_DN8838_c0_g1_i1:117-1991(+)
MAMSCRICLEVAVNPRVTKCGHVFCVNHIDQWIADVMRQRKSLSCPVCRQVLDPENDLISVFADSTDEPVDLENINVGESLAAIAKRYDKLVMERAHLAAEVRLWETKSQEQRVTVESLAAENKQLRAQLHAAQLQLQQSRGKSPHRKRHRVEQPRTGFVPLSNVCDEGGALSAMTGTSGPDVAIASTADRAGTAVNGTLLSGGVYSQDSGSTQSLNLSSQATTDNVTTTATAGGVGVGVVGAVAGSTAQQVVRPSAPAPQPHAMVIASDSEDDELQILDGPVPSSAAQLHRTLSTTWRQVHRCEAHPSFVHTIDVHHSQPLVAAASMICTIHDAESGRILRRLVGHTRSVYCARFCPTQKDLLATCAAAPDSSTIIWDIALHQDDARIVATLPGDRCDVMGVAWHPNEHRLLSCGEDSTVRIWDLQTLQATHTLRNQQGALYTAAFSARNGELVASGSSDFSVYITDWRSLTVVRTLHDHTEEVMGTDFHPSGNYLATSSDDATCRIWDMRMWRAVQVLSEPQQQGGDMKRCRFSPDGKMLLTTSGANNLARVWDCSSAAQQQQSQQSQQQQQWTMLQELPMTNSDPMVSAVYDGAWAADASFLVTCSEDCSWRLWQPLRVSM